MFSLAYISTATATMGDTDLTALLAQSRVNNRHARVTGFLLYSTGRFLQFLEGPEESVRDKMRVIATDPRHRTVAVLLEAHSTKARRFPRWNMGFQPVDDQMVGAIPGFKQTFTAPGDPTAAESEIWELIEWFQKHAEGHQ